MYAYIVPSDNQKVAKTTQNDKICSEKTNMDFDQILYKNHM